MTGPCSDRSFNELENREAWVGCQPRFVVPGLWIARVKLEQGIGSRRALNCIAEGGQGSRWLCCLGIFGVVSWWVSVMSVITTPRFQILTMDAVYFGVIFGCGTVSGEWAGRHFIWETRDGHLVEESQSHEAHRRFDNSASNAPHRPRRTVFALAGISRRASRGSGAASRDGPFGQDAALHPRIHFIFRPVSSVSTLMLMLMLMPMLT